jgi:hypothetical protein
VKRIALILAAVAMAVMAGRTTAWAGGKSSKSKSGDAPTPGDPYQRLCKAYMDGTWDDLEKDLKPGKEPPGLTAEQRVELAAIRAAFAECRPAWWQSCKAKLAGQIHPVVWGRTLDMTFDPAGGEGLRMSVANNRIALTVSWPTADMDNREPKEHGFSKGDMINFLIWNTMGRAQSWSQVSSQALLSPSEKDKMGLAHYQFFRSDVTSFYYGTPTARRWSAFLYLVTWKPHYAAQADALARKANAAMFLVEALTDPAKYPTLSVPRSVAADGAEEKLAGQYANWIEKHAFTVAEDIALRKAIQKFAAANNDPLLLRTQQIVTLPNKLAISLDPAGDEKLRPLRDAWLKKQVDKANSSAGKQRNP